MRDDKKLVFASYRAEPTVKTLRAYANGEFGDAHFNGTDCLDPDAKHVPELCKALSCSADYLLGMTDELMPVSKSDNALGEWRTDDDFPDGQILLLMETDGTRRYALDTAQGGMLCIYPADLLRDTGMRIVRWLQLTVEEDGGEA